MIVRSHQFDMSEPRTYMVTAEVHIPYRLGDGSARRGNVRKTSNTIEIKVVESADSTEEFPWPLTYSHTGI